MTDDDIKTPIEADIEALRKEMADMKATYEAKITEYQEANKGLWARLNTVQDDAPADTPQPARWDTDTAVTAFKKNLGL